MCDSVLYQQPSYIYLSRFHLHRWSSVVAAVAGVTIFLLFYYWFNSSVSVCVFHILWFYFDCFSFSIIGFDHQLVSDCTINDHWTRAFCLNDNQFLSIDFYFISVFVWFSLSICIDDIDPVCEVTRARGVIFDCCILCVRVRIVKKCVTNSKLSQPACRRTSMLSNSEIFVSTKIIPEIYIKYGGEGGGACRQSRLPRRLQFTM